MVEEIRIITLWQPWAGLIAKGVKRYETRSWGTRYRGKLAIHASRREIADLPSCEAGDPVWQALLEITAKPHYGFILAIADLTDCLKMSRAGGFTQGAGEICIDHQTAAERDVGDWTPGRFAWKLENIKPLDEPIPYRGGQGLRKITDYETLLAIAARI